MTLCQISEYTIYCGEETKWILQISLTKNQISGESDILRESPDISFAKFISDIKLIHGTYRNFTFTVNLRVRKLRVSGIKIGKFMGSDSPV
jgi:hypothetical protein